MYDDEYSAASSGVGIFAAVLYFMAIACAIIVIAGYWKIFTKAGEEGWKSLIPFLNTYILFQIAWGNGILFLLLFVPVVNIVVTVMLQFKLARAFGQSDGFAFGLLFLPYIFYLILGFGSSEYIGPAPAPVRNPVADETRAFKFCGHCGAKISKTAKFCGHCGTPVLAVPQQLEPAGEPAFDSDPVSFEAPVPFAEPAPASYDMPADDSKLDHTILTGRSLENLREEEAFSEEEPLAEPEEKTEVIFDDVAAAGPVLKMTEICEDGIEGDEFSVVSTPFVVGRTTVTADHGIDARGISKRHLQFDCEEDLYYVTDLDSTNGVSVNGEKIVPLQGVLVQNGDTIKIGLKEFEVEIV